MSFRNMSDLHPMDEFANRCNESCNSLWKYIRTLTKHIDALPEGDSKEYLKQYKSTLGMIAELYFFTAVSISHIRGLEEGEVKALFKEVFKTEQSLCHMNLKRMEHYTIL